MAGVGALIGLSPRLRGNRLKKLEVQPGTGLSPRLRGNRLKKLEVQPGTGLSPRLRGNRLKKLEVQPGTGLSPRLRGNQPSELLQQRGPRSIPAPAGEPLPLAPQPLPCTVYPRACGGTVQGLQHLTPQCGLSPRLRGNPPAELLGNAGEGSIPAPAGEPPSTCGNWTPSRVYPRACGGTRAAMPASANMKGLSPRLRGNLEGSMSKSPTSGSIPAPAGEPRWTPAISRPAWVYPRACGGTGLGRGVGLGLDGLSPRLRGTSPSRRPAAYSSGLSPRLRGNLLSAIRLNRSSRSIPAPAGEPKWSSTAIPSSWVYPRACGGTATRACGRSVGRGLSPRLRGNQLAHGHQQDTEGSIPAPAGEPEHDAGILGREGVYPRACGEPLRSVPEV